MIKYIVLVLVIFCLAFFIITFISGVYKTRSVMNIYVNEISAFVSCKTIYEAIDTYHKVHGQYPASLKTLGSSNSPYICEDLAEGKRQGYRYVYEPTSLKFFVMASPLQFITTGRFYFHINELKRITICDQEGNCMTENQYLTYVKGLVKE
ncbi:MAG: hypothetical protein AMJ95_07710 [Omnitrophica WOR_2 bacterium SM23_72]|nr:MAG: hypothetical protein AMJ95_07710 [Omnitrophica WOR_2 bacterium SM23_72]